MNKRTKIILMEAGRGKKTWALVCFALGAFLLGNPLATQAALNSPDLTIVTSAGYSEGHLISFPYSSTTLSIDCASGTINTYTHGDNDHCPNQDYDDLGPDDVYVGQVLYSDGAHDVKVTVVDSGPGDDNDDSMALWVKYKGFDYLTAGDKGGSGESRIASWINQRGINIDVWKVSHHGSCTYGTSDLSFFQSIRPEYATITGTATGPCRASCAVPGDNTIINLIYAGAKKIYCAPSYDLGCIGSVPSGILRNGTGVLTIRTDGQTLSISGNSFTDGPFPVDDYVAPTPTPPPSPTPSPTPTLIPGEVIINEILANVPLGIEGDANGDGVRSYWQDEFVELVNWTNHTVNLGGCTISDSSYTRFTFADPLLIPSGKALVLFGGGEPTGEFGGAITLIASTQSYYGLGLNNPGDTVTLRNGDEIYDMVTYGQQNTTSINRWPEIRGSFHFHNLIPEAAGRLFSPGTKVNGEDFEYEPSPTPLTPNTFPTPDYLVLEDGDYDGDGTVDIAIYRNGIGLWAVKEVTRVYFGSSSDLPIPADYDGDGTTDIAVYKPASGLWAIRNVSRIYYGSSGDLPIPADYDGDGSAEVGIFRERSGLWAVRGVTRLYFGATGDVPVPGDYNGDGDVDIGIFRERSGLWAIKLPTWTPRVYFGAPGDRPIAGDYSDSGLWTPAVFRGSSGLWAIRNLTRCYFGGDSDRPVPADYDSDGADDPGVFRAGSGLWAVRGVTRTYFGGTGAFPVTR